MEVENDWWNFLLSSSQVRTKPVASTFYCLSLLRIVHSRKIWDQDSGGVRRVWCQRSSRSSSRSVPDWRDVSPRSPGRCVQRDTCCSLRSYQHWTRISQGCSGTSGGSVSDEGASRCVRDGQRPPGGGLIGSEYHCLVCKLSECFRYCDSVYFFMHVLYLFERVICHRLILHRYIFMGMVLRLQLLQINCERINQVSDLGSLGQLQNTQTRTLTTNTHTHSHTGKHTHHTQTHTQTGSHTKTH